MEGGLNIYLCFTDHVFPNKKDHVYFSCRHLFTLGFNFHVYWLNLYVVVHSFEFRIVIIFKSSSYV
jgi:hypothetical protein